MNPYARCVSFLLAAAIFSGCTHISLRRNTVRQASTLTELQYQMVLNNLAMFCSDQDAVPWHIALSGGTSQIADTGSLSVLFDLNGGTVTHPNPLASRSIVEQWSTVPVTDDTNLKLLQKAYQGAIWGQPSILNEDDANDLGHALSLQIGTNSDMSIVVEALRSQGEALKTLQMQMRLSDQSKAKKIFELIDERKTDLSKMATTLLEKFLVDDGKGKFKLINKDKKCVNEDEASGLARETLRQVNSIQETLIGIPSGWFTCGTRKEVPRDACYVGHYGDCYVWVCAEGRAGLSKMTLAVLQLSGTIKDSQVMTIPTGLQFSPATSGVR